MRQRPAGQRASSEAAAAASAPVWRAEWLATRLETVEEQLALDEALLEEAHEGLASLPVARTWMANEPTVVVGSSSRLDEEIDRAACAALGVRVVRRPSGGLTVVLGPGCLMWSVIVPHPAGAPAGCGTITDHIRQPGPSTTVSPPLGRRTTRTPRAAQAARSISSSRRLEDPTTTVGSFAIHVRATGSEASPSWASSRSASSSASCSSTVSSRVASHSARQTGAEAAAAASLLAR